MLTWSYPATLEPVGADEILVRFPDIPEALTSGVDEADALAQAADVLEEAVLACLAEGRPVPHPRAPRAGERAVDLDPVTAARAALAVAMQEAKVSNTALAARLGRTEGSVRRLLDGRSGVKLETVRAALNALGKRTALVVG